METVYYANRGNGHGLSPTEKQGNTIVLHHDKQNATGSITAMPNKHHDKPHSNPDGKRKGGGLADAGRTSFNKRKKEYWKSQAEKGLRKKVFVPNENYYLNDL